MFSIAGRAWPRNCEITRRDAFAMYHGSVYDLAKLVEKYIDTHQLLSPGDRVAVAVSGGADSLALLLVMTELRSRLGIILSVVHFNHNLRGAESDADEQFVRDVCRQHALELFCEGGLVSEYAANSHISLETAARTLRYQYFSRLLRTAPLNCVATAHTLDDQAETVLLKVIRGAGTRGLSGIYPKLTVEDLPNPRKSIVRPFLEVRRTDIESYLVKSGQTWREDESNRDLRHSRNLARHLILPTIADRLNPSVRRNLAETAEIARAEEEYWTARMHRDIPEIWKTEPEIGIGGKLNADLLSARPLAIQRRIIREIAEMLELNLEFNHVERILLLASSDQGVNLSAVLPAGWIAVRDGEDLSFRRNEDASRKDADYEYVLPVPGRVVIAEAGRVVEAALIKTVAESGYNSDCALDSGLTANELLVRNWRPGDRFWPRHTKRPKKVKELLQERRLTGADRRMWPVVVNGNEVVWLSGFPARATLHLRTGQAVIINDQTL